MRDFPNLDTALFRGFYFAAQSLNFTLAARNAGMTQSGMSQQISKLEEQLGTQLFLRVGRKVILTDAGKKLQKHVEVYLDQVESLTEALREEQKGIQGCVTYAMPASCLMTPHFELLLKERKKRFQDLELNVTLCPSSEVVSKLLEGLIDFGFVTQKTQHLDVRFTPFCPEEYVLIAAKKEALARVEPSTLAEANYIGHPGVEVLFDYWFSHHFPRSKPIQWDSLKAVGGMNSLAGVIQMVEAGMGLTVIPRHCVSELIQKRRLFEYRNPSGKSAQSMIHIVTLSTAVLPKRVQSIIDVFLSLKSTS